MPHQLAVRLHVEHRHAAKLAGIGRLPAALGVERALIERHRRPATKLAACDHLRAKLRHVGIGKV